MTITTIKTANLSPVTFKAQGFDGTVSPAAFESIEAFDAVLTYGIRRMVQDHVNAWAKAERDAGREPSEAAIKSTVTERVSAILSGDTGSRGPALDPHTALRVEVIKAAHTAKKAPAWVVHAPESIVAAMGEDTIRAANIAAALGDASESYLAAVDRAAKDRAAMIAKRAQDAAKRAADMAALAESLGNVAG